MSNEEIIVRSEVTEKTAGLDLFLRGIRKSLKFNALGKSKTIYSMVALTSPIKIDEASASIFSNSSLLKQAAALFKELTERSQGKFMFFARLDGPNTAHSFIPNPCTLDFAKDIEAACEMLGKKHKEHIAVYGSGNEQRLTGLHETCSIDEFRYGNSDRGASIRIPMQTCKDGCGYLEDRRPSANMDPYRVCTALMETICDSVMVEV